jgi:hypothetical protein
MSNTTVVATLVIDTGDLGTQGLLTVRVPYQIYDYGTVVNHSTMQILVNGVVQNYAWLQANQIPHLQTTDLYSACDVTTWGGVVTVTVQIYTHTYLVTGTVLNHATGHAIVELLRR